MTGEQTHERRRFEVDDVDPSGDTLAGEPVVATLRHRLMRELVTGPRLNHHVVRSTLCSPNPLVAAVHLAFSRHLPLTLSPDAVWLTIVQGFSHHINQHAEEFRGRLVRHQGREQLSADISGLAIEHLEPAISEFSSQIRDATDPAVHDALLCDFSTTTPETRTASEIALMDTYSQYFDFKLMLCICGIPYVTLTGTVDDWRRMRGRVEVLRTFGLDWWVSRLGPVLDQFVQSAEGRPDREFWRGIYKFRPAKSAYDPQFVTGWILNLFPYLGDAPKRTRNPVFDVGAPQEVKDGSFPFGLCSVPVLLTIVNGNRQTLATQELDLVAGLCGVEQSREDGALSPVISWCLAHRAGTKQNHREPGRLQ